MLKVANNYWQSPGHISALTKDGNNMNKLSLAFAVAASLLAMPSVALASIDPLLQEAPKLYILGGAGSAMINTESTGVTPAGRSLESDTSTTQTSYRIAGGVQLANDGALELGYTDFGDSSKSGGTTLSGFSAGIVIATPLGQSPFDLVLRSDVYVLNHSYLGSEENTIPGIGLGIGTRLNLTNGVFIQAEYEAIYYIDKFNNAFSGGRISTLLHHPSIQAGIAF